MKEASSMEISACGDHQGRSDGLLVNLWRRSISYRQLMLLIKDYYENKIPGHSISRGSLFKYQSLYSFQNGEEEITFDLRIFIAIASMHRIFAK
jgi:hypothetical protein